MLPQLTSKMDYEKILVSEVYCTGETQEKPRGNLIVVGGRRPR